MIALFVFAGIYFLVATFIVITTQDILVAIFWPYCLFRDLLRTLKGDQGSKSIESSKTHRRSSYRSDTFDLIGDTYDDYSSDSDGGGD